MRGALFVVLLFCFGLSFSVSAAGVCQQCKHGFIYNSGKCECQGEESSSFKDDWQGAHTHGVIDFNTLASKNYDVTQLVLSQIVNGHAIFRYVGPSFNPLASVTIGVKKSSLGKVVLSEGVQLIAVTKCLRFSKDQDWENEKGFPMTVKTFSAIECPVKQSSSDSAVSCQDKCFGKEKRHQFKKGESLESCLQTSCK